MRCMMAVVLSLGIPCLCVSQGSRRNPSINRGQIVMGETLTHADSPWVWANEDTPRQTSAMSGAGIVSANDLNVPEKAVKELQRAEKARSAGDVQGAISHAEKALAIHPNWSLAYNELGILHTMTMEYDKAMEEFEKALEANRRFGMAASNIATALCLQQRYAEAEPAARRALEMEPGLVMSQYILGTILVNEGKNTTEAKLLLEKARGEYPRAWLFLAKTEMERGENEEAMESLRVYLRTADAGDRSVAQGWLDKLTKKDAERKRAGEGTVASVD